MPQNPDWFSQFEEPKKDDFFSQFEQVGTTPKQEPSKGIFDTGLDYLESGLKSGSEFINAHPLARRFLFGPSKEELGGRDVNAITTAPGEIPGLRKLTGAIKNNLISSGSYPLGFAGGLIDEMTPSLVEGAFDPAQAGIKLPVKAPTRLLTAGEGAAHVVTPEGIVKPNRDVLSMREQLGGRLPQNRLKDIEVKPTSVKEVTPEDYINAVKSGEAKGISYPEFQELQKSSADPENRLLGEFIDRLGADWPSKYRELYANRLERPEGLSIPGESIEPRPDAINPNQSLLKFNPFEDIQFARTEGGHGVKIGADIKSLGKVLGSSLYKGDIGTIATKELLQNAVDATRHLGPDAHIMLKTSESGSDLPFIEVSDNGKGMTKQELETVFTDLGASGKREDQSASGGFGLAKAAPLLGGEKVEVTSRVVEDGRVWEHKFNGTPDELIEGVNVISKRLPPDTKTGTTVRTYLPKKEYGGETYQAREFFNQFVENSPGLQAKFEHGRRFGTYDYPPNEIVPKTRTGKTITLNHPLADVDITIPEGSKYAERMGVPTKILNNNIYQASTRYGGYSTLPSIPEKVLINIRSKVAEGHPDYPWTANREELRGPVNDLVSKYISENIINPGINARSHALKTAYDSMPISNGIYYYDVGKRFSPEEFKAMVEHPTTQAIASQIDDLLSDALRLQRNTQWKDKLERVGVIFDDSVKGIHIPNPGTGHSAILINPYQIMVGRTPEQASAGILHTILHELAHVEGGGHDENFTIRLSEIYEKYGAERAIDAQNAILGNLDGGNGEYLPEVQELLQRYQESRGRQSTIDDPLYATGIGSRNKGSEGSGKIPDDPRPPAARAVTKLLNALADARINRAEQETLYSAERGRRAKAFENVKEGGQTGFFKSLGKLGGEMPKVEPEGDFALNKKDVDDLYSAIKFNKRITTFEKARTGVALKKLLDGVVPQRNEIALLDRVFGNGFGDQIVQMQGGLGAIPIKFAKAANTMKTLMSSLDVSAPFRQGLGLVHRREFWNAFRYMFKYGASENAFSTMMQGLEERPNFLLGRDSGLYLAQHEKGSFEEHFMDSYLNDLRHSKGIFEKSNPTFNRRITEPFAASERAYTGFLNKLRADTFDALVQQAEKAGYQVRNANGEATEFSKAIAKYVNVSTGRGGLGPLSKMSEELNSVFFSPRLISSRLSILNPAYYIKAPAFVRKEALKTLLAMGTFTTIVGGLGSILGGRQNFQSTNPDFGKVKFGRTRLDPGGGLNQYIVAASQAIQGKATSSENQNTYPLGKYGQPTRGGKIFGLLQQQPSFMENKLSPMAGLIDNILAQRRDVNTGKPYSFSDDIKNRFTPLVMQDAFDLAKSDPSLLPLLAPASLGMGLQTYQPRQQKSGLSLGGL